MLNKALDNFKQRAQSRNSLVTFARTMFKCLRNLFVNSFYELLKQNERFRTVCLLMSILALLQNSLIPFSRCLVSVWKFDIATSILSKALGWLTIAPIIASLGFGPYLAFSITLLALLIIQVIGLIIISRSSSFRHLNLKRIVIFLKWLLRAYLTFLNLPCLFAGMMAFDCQPANSETKILSFSATTVCYRDIHWIAVAVSIAMLLLHISVSVMASLWYADISFNSSDIFAQKPSLAPLIMLAHQAIFAFLAIFYDTTGIQYLKAIIFWIFQVIVLYLLVQRRPYFNQFYMRLITAATAANFWSYSMTLIALMAEGGLFNGSFAIWAVIFPVVFIRVFISRDDKAQILLVSLEKTQSGDSVLEHLTLLLKIALNYKHTTEYSILLEGFYEHHISVCSDNQCPLKPNEKGLSRKTNIQVLNYLEYAFQKAVAKFPNHIDLKIYHMIYLLEVSKRPFEALIALEKVQEKNVNFQYLFAVTRLHKTLKEVRVDQTIIEMVNSGKMVDINEVPFQELLKKFQSIMERTTTLYSDIWAHLQEESQDLKRLMFIGKAILINRKKIEKIWDKFYRYSLSNRAKYLMFYGRFLKCVANEQNSGSGFIAESHRLMKAAINKRSDLAYIKMDADVSEIGVAMIAVSLSEFNFGLIVKVNQIAAILFGYKNSAEMLNQNIKRLIPETLNMHHDAYLRQAISAKTPMQTEKTLVAFGKNKAGYLMQLIINIKGMFGENPIFYAQIRTVREFTATAFFLTDYKGRIETTSTGVIQLFGLSLYEFNANPNINSMFANLFNRKESIMEVGEEILSFESMQPKIQEHVGHKRLIKVSVTSHKHRLMIKEYYVFKFWTEPIEDMKIAVNYSKASDFRFQLNQNSLKIVGLFQKFDEITHEEFAHSRKLGFRKAKKMNSGSDSSRSLKELVKELKVSRLSGGKIVDIDDEEDEENKLEAIKKQAELQQMERDRQNQERLELSKSIREQIEVHSSQSKLLQKIPVAKEAKIFIVSIVLLLISLMIILYLSFDHSLGVMRKAPKHYEFYVSYNQIISDLLNCSQTVQRLTLATKTSISLEDERTLRAALLFFGQRVQDSSAKLEDLLKTINEPIYYEAMLDGTFSIISGSSVIEMNFVTVIKEIVTSVLILANMPLAEFSPDLNGLAIELTHNILHNIYDSQVNMLDKILAVMKSEIEDDKFLVIQQPLKWLITLLGLCLTYFHKRFVYRKINDLMQFFVDIPPQKARQYLGECEGFFRRLQITNYIDDIAEEIECDQEKEDQDHNQIIGRKRRRSRSLKICIAKQTVIKLFMGLLITTGLLVVGYIMQARSNNALLVRNSELSVITKIPLIYHSYLNNLMSDCRRKIMGKMSGFKTDRYTEWNNQTNQINSEFDRVFYEIEHRMTTTYDSIFLEIRQNNLCSLLDKPDYLFSPFYKPTQASCELLLQNSTTTKIVSDGLMLTINRYQKNLETVYRMCSFIDPGNSKVAPEILGESACKGKSPVNLFCIFESETFTQTYEIQNYYVYYFFKQLLGLLFTQILTSEINFLMNLQAIILLINIVVVIFIFYFFILREFIRDRARLKDAQKIALIVPLDNLENSPDMRNYFQLLLSQAR